MAACQITVWWYGVQAVTKSSSRGGRDWAGELIADAMIGRAIQSFVPLCDVSIRPRWLERVEAARPSSSSSSLSLPPLFQLRSFGTRRVFAGNNSLALLGRRPDAK